MNAFLKLLLCFIFPGLLWSTTQPNIVFILSDDVGTGDIKCYYEDSKVTTPNIDRLAAEGMRFTQAYAPGAVCSPTRYALISGFYPCRGPLRDAPAGATSPLSFATDMVTLPTFLKAQGYRTAHIGKWHLGYGETGIRNWAGEISPGPNNIGFDYHLGLPTNHNDNFKTYVENDRLLWLKPEVTRLSEKPTKDQLSKIRYDDEVDSTLTSKAIEFIKENREQPFFVYLALVATHTHITPHKRFRGTSEIGQLGDYINELDFHVGEIMHTLEILDLADDTILIFSSDNGGQQNDHHTAGKNLDLRDASNQVAEKAKSAKTVARTEFGHKTNGDFRGYKGSNYEGGFRVPFIVRWPGKVTAGSESDQVICHSDVLATTAGFLNKALPKEAAGDSFDMSPVLLGTHDGSPIRRTTILQTGRGLLSFREDDWKLRFSKNPTWSNEDVALPEAEFELYNLSIDPGESNDLAAKHPDRAQAMRATLLDLLQKGRSR